VTWPSLPLEEICRPKQWPTLSLSQLKLGEYPVYGANGKVGFNDTFTHASPTVIITCRGATCGTINVTEPTSYVNGNAMALDDLRADMVDLQFLKHYLECRGLKDTITGSAQPQITRETLRRVSVPIPPLAEQKRIAAILDKADAIRRRRQEAARLADTLIPSVFYEMFGDPVKNPNSYVPQRIEDFCRTGTGGTPSRDRAEFYGGETPWVKSGELKENWIAGTEEHVSDDGIAASRLRLLPAGTILLALYGATVGRMARLSIPATTNQAVCHIVPDEDVAHPTWLYQALRLKVPEMLAQRVGGAQPNISQGLVKALSIGLPSPAAQKDFVRHVERVEQLTNRQATARDESDSFFNGLVQRAFRGEL